MEVPDSWRYREYEGFIKDSRKWVIFPRLSFLNHAMIEERNPKIGEDFSSYSMNSVQGSGRKAVFASGVSYAYAKECLQDHPEVRFCKIATPYPFPESFVLSALEGVEEVLCVEELSPYIENALLKLIGKHQLPVKVYGKLTGHIASSGENSTDSLRQVLGDFLGISMITEQMDLSDSPSLPVRPPVLCAGCPHRASFYAVKKAMEGLSLIHI